MNGLTLDEEEEGEEKDIEEGDTVLLLAVQRPFEFSRSDLLW